ncbi:MAG TPA: hypothetical protein VGC91_16085 [Pyrinomonadaceae bacterium]|jgi:hypothetical protein
MINRRTLTLIFAVSLIALALPALAAAQGSSDPNGDYGRNRDDRRDDRRNDDRYDQRRLRDSTRRLKDLSGDFRRHLDSALDRSRYDSSRREDNINDTAREFQDAAGTLKDRTDDSRNLSRSSNEARRVLQLGAQLDRFMERSRFQDGRVTSDWSRIRQELRAVADIYGFNWSDFDDRYYRDDNRRDDDSRRRNRRNTNYPW